MAKKELLFEDLIDLLKVIHTPEDIQNNLFDEMLNATLVIGLAAITEHHNCSDKEAIQVLRMAINKHLDSIASA